MRSLPAALLGLLCCPGIATAAPFAELPFVRVSGAGEETLCLNVGGDRVAVVVETAAARVNVFRVSGSGGLARDGGIRMRGVLETLGFSAISPGAPLP